jgi:hypothetical protein
LSVLVVLVETFLSLPGFSFGFLSVCLHFISKQHLSRP